MAALSAMVLYHFVMEPGAKSLVVTTLCVVALVFCGNILWGHISCGSNSFYGIVCSCGINLCVKCMCFHDLDGHAEPHVLT